MFQFHGSDVIALDGTETLKAVSNFIASACRGRADRRTRLLTPEMLECLVEKDNNIIVSYLAFCDLLGRRTVANGVYLREVGFKAVARKVRQLHSLRRAGLDVFQMNYARMGKGDVGLLITGGFVHDNAAIPAFFKAQAAQLDIEEILEAGRLIREAA